MPCRYLFCRIRFDRSYIGYHITGPHAMATRVNLIGGYHYRTRCEYNITLYISLSKAVTSSVSSRKRFVCLNMVYSSVIAVCVMVMLDLKTVSYDFLLPMIKIQN